VTYINWSDGVIESMQAESWKRSAVKIVIVNFLYRSVLDAILTIIR
jgi:hypothetical protein